MEAEQSQNSIQFSCDVIEKELEKKKDLKQLN